MGSPAARPWRVHTNKRHADYSLIRARPSSSVSSHGPVQRGQTGGGRGPGPGNCPRSSGTARPVRALPRHRAPEFPTVFFPSAEQAGLVLVPALAALGQETRLAGRVCLGHARRGLPDSVGRGGAGMVAGNAGRVRGRLHCRWHCRRACDYRTQLGYGWGAGGAGESATGEQQPGRRVPESCKGRLAGRILGECDSSLPNGLAYALRLA